MQFALFVLTAWMWVGGTFGEMTISLEPDASVIAHGGSSVPPPPPGP